MEFLRLLVISILAIGCALAQSCKRENSVDVLILGAGIAGVAAARTLHENSKTSYIVLEANDKIGGRIRRDNARNVELGANWIHGLDRNNRHLHPLWEVWQECDPDGPDGFPSPVETNFHKVYGMQGTFQYNISNQTGDYKTRRTQYEEAEMRAKENLNVTNETVSVRSALMEHGWTPNSSLDQFIEWNKIDYCFAVGPEDLSLIHTFSQTVYEEFLGGNNDSEASCFVVTDEKGYSFVVDCLARDFKNTTRLKLNAKVTRVEVSDDCVCATVQNGETYCASYAIMTFSMGVLQASIRGYDDAIQFEPELPIDAINQVTMVHFVKIFLKFKEQFWKEFQGEEQYIGYVSETRGYYPTFLILKDISNTIHVHVTGDLALQVLEQDKEDTMNDIMVVLRKIFNDSENISNPVDIEISQWDTDPLFLGSYEAYGPGVPEDIFDELHKPVNNRLYLAGSALNKSHFGFVHGAYGSGVNVAKNVAKKLDGNNEVDNTVDDNGEFNFFELVPTIIVFVSIFVVGCCPIVCAIICGVLCWKSYKGRH